MAEQPDCPNPLCFQGMDHYRRALKRWESRREEWEASRPPGWIARYEDCYPKPEPERFWGMPTQLTFANFWLS